MNLFKVPRIWSMRLEPGKLWSSGNYDTIYKFTETTKLKFDLGEKLDKGERQKVYDYRIKVDEQIAFVEQIQRHWVHFKRDRYNQFPNGKYSELAVASEKYWHLILKRLYKDPAKISAESQLSNIENELNQRKEGLESIRQQLKSLKVRLSPVDCILYITELTGFQATSIFIAATGLAGAVYSYFYFRTIGTSVIRYATPQDLLFQGFAVLPFVVGILLVIGMAFLLVQTAMETGERIRKVILPIFSLLFHHFLWVYLILSVGVLSIIGFRDGHKTIPGNTDLLTETAVLEDHSQLNNVRLVGTTERTAVFVTSADQNESEEEAHNQSPFAVMSDYFHIWKQLITNIFSGPQSVAIDDSHKRSVRVITVDRAHVLCHSADDACGTEIDHSTRPLATRAIPVSRVLPIPFNEPFASVTSFEEYASTFLNCSPAEELHSLPESVFFQNNDAKHMCKKPTHGEEGCMSFELPEFSEHTGDTTIDKIWVAGFASNTGYPSYNSDLAELRAIEVATALTKKGWNNIHTLSLGEVWFTKREYADYENPSLEDQRVDILACSTN